jgi:hypothetical protein
MFYSHCQECSIRGYLVAFVHTNDHAYVTRGSVIVGILWKNTWLKINGITAKSLLIKFCARLKQKDVCWSDARALSVNAVP